MGSFSLLSAIHAHPDGRLDQSAQALAEGEDEARAPAQIRFRADRALVAFHDVLADRQAQPGPPVPASRRSIRLDERAETLTRRFVRYRGAQGQRLHLARSRLLLLSPRRAIQDLRQRLDQLSPRLVLSWRRAEENRRRHLDYCESHLAKLDPMSILKRGYAVATRLPEGTVIRDATLVPSGAAIEVKVAKGAMTCEVVDATE